nr:MAG TPA: hypothetical protein [Caudoviricetes sp.]
MIIVYRYNVSLNVIFTKLFVICRTRCYCCCNLFSRLLIKSIVNTIRSAFI